MIVGAGSDTDEIEGVSDNVEIDGAAIDAVDNPPYHPSLITERFWMFSAGDARDPHAKLITTNASFIFARKTFDLFRYLEANRMKF